MKASEFKAKCLRLMSEVAQTGEPIVITKNGKPVSKLVPYDQQPKSLLGLHKGGIQYDDDLIDPIGEAWNADN